MTACLTVVMIASSAASCAFPVIGVDGGVLRHVAGDDDEHHRICSPGVGAGLQV